MAFLRGWIFLFVAIHYVVATRVTLTNNGYSDLVVAISPDVPKTEAFTIIDNIKDMITKASSALYVATRNRAYFKSVRILIPKEWDNVQAAFNTWETYTDADVQVDNHSGRYGDKPRTVQPGGCGEPGKTIMLTPGFLVNGTQSGQFGSPEKLFVVEWARLRYGVFEEFGSADDPRHPLFYVSTSSRIVPNGCFYGDDPMYRTEDINGGACSIDTSTGLYDKNCTIVWSPNYRPTSSLMTYRQVESVVHFCDDITHNREAPTKHNDLCMGKSVWSVITQHDDFTNNKNPPRNITALQPTFTVVKAEPARFVLLADISGSMNDYDRIGRLNKAGRRWIQYDVADGSRVGIVSFESTASINNALTAITNTTRSTLAAKVPSIASGGTCIGCGLQTAMQVLGTNVNKGGVILLISDGEENVQPFVSQVMPQLIASEARVVSMAFGQNAAKLIEDLAEQTDGKSYFINDDVTMSGLNSAFDDSLTYQPVVTTGNIVVKHFEKRYKNSGTVLRDTFAIDSTVGRNLQLRLEYSSRSYIVTAQLTSPSKVVYTNVIYDTIANLGYINIADAEVGTWTFQVTVSTSTVDYVTVSVTSQTRTNSIPITTKCYIGTGPTVIDPTAAPVKIIAEVFQGRGPGGNPVIGAKVKAYVEQPDLTISVFDLRDDGVFADTTANDGIYSRFFVSLNNVGRYSVICQVHDEGSAYIDNGFIANSAPLNGRSRSMGRTATGNFTRSSIGGSFSANKTVSRVDPYPPGRVVDLRVIAIEVYNMTVTLQWTAPGDDLDSGKVRFYRVKYSNNSDDVFNDNFQLGTGAIELAAGNIYHGSLEPLEAGNVQTVTFYLPLASINTTYYFALRAYDDANKTSPTSNVASIQIVPTEPVPDLPPFTCPGDGNYPQSGQCSRYYYVCISGKFYTGSCSPSQVFEPFNRTCVPAGSAVDCRVTRCQADGNYPLSEQCNSHYIICLSGLGYSGICPGSEVFDPVKLECVPQHESACCTTSTTADPPVPTREPFTCPDSYGYYAIPGQCAADYYICSEWVAYLQTCPGSTLFDPETWWCTRPRNVSCREIEFQCPDDDGFYAVPGKCVINYYICLEGNATLQSCPENSIFDPVLLRCVKEDKASCRMTTTSTPTIRTTPASVPTLATTFTCPNDGYFPSSSGCSSDYYLCVNGNAYLQSCPGTAVFNPQTKLCTNNSSFCDDTTPFQCPESNGHFPFPGQCSGNYYICVNFIEYPQRCPNGAIFDPVPLTCVPEQYASCTNPSTDPSVTAEPETTDSAGNFVCPQQFGNFQHDSSCFLFYSCVNYVPVVRHCPADLVFNHQYDFCDYPPNVPGCENAYIDK